MKLVALDLDGTLLNRGGTIAEETLSEMHRLYQKGVYIAIATGRPYKDTIRFLTDNGLHPEDGYPYALVCNEREIYFLRDGAFRSWEPWNGDAYDREFSLLPTTLQVISTAADEHSIEFLVNNNFMQRDRGFVETFFSSPEAAIASLPLFAEKLKGHPLKPVRNGRLIAFRWEKIGKDLMLEKVVQELQVQPHEILAVGDSHNDMGMLQCFNAATTQNADDEVKRLVREKNGMVAASPFSLGVAEILSTL